MPAANTMGGGGGNNLLSVNENVYCETTQVAKSRWHFYVYISFTIVFIETKTNCDF